jgi:type II restriction enzyme
MALNNEQILQIEKVLKDSLRHKFQNYQPEPASMPFHTRLLGKDRMALFSFIHSLNTNFGTTIFEPVALALASSNFKVAKSQHTAGVHISDKAQRVIQDILDDLTVATRTPNKTKEIEAIRNVCQDDILKTVKPTKVDLWLESYDNEIFLFDIKTSKPNKGGFKEFKRTLLEWVAVILSENPNANVNTLIAIPYNPYEPKPYSRWTMAGMLDLEKELKVAEEFWDFLAGKGTYNQLLLIFEKVGIELRDEIDEYFSRFQNKNHKL